MKTLKLLGLIGLFSLYVSCKSDIEYTANETEIIDEYSKNWVTKFGLINPAQDWNMAKLVTADVNPADFGNGVKVLIYTDHPAAGGMLIGRATSPTTLKLDMVSYAQMVYIRAVDANGNICYSAPHQVADGKVDMRNRAYTHPLPQSRAPQLIEGEDGNVFPWMIACEDLGSTGDYDFNDIVIGLQHVAGDPTLKIYPMACGGLKTSEIYFYSALKDANIRLGEIHGLFGVASNSMHNTFAWEAPGDILEVDVPADWTLAEKLNDLYILVCGETKSQKITAPNKGEAPQLLCLRGDWFWPRETISIEEAYPEFSQLNSLPNISYDWMGNIPDIEKVIVWKFPLREFDTEAYDRLSIPEDPDNYDVPDKNDDSGNEKVSNPQINVGFNGGYVEVKLNLTGIWDEGLQDWMTLYGTGDANQNVWLSVDGTSKGLDAYNNSEESSIKFKTDVVFLIDNSGSMYQEANAVAASVISWSQALLESNIDVAVGCVGYGEGSYAINGAFNMNTPDAIKAYLNYGSGTSRTQHFGGPDGSTLKSIAQSGNYSNGSNAECGMIALRFANDNYNFRAGANRIYINFTDEVNQPQGNSNWSVEYLNPIYNHWMSNSGTVHTVFSYSPTSLLTNSERPWLMSEYTGGTTVFTDPSFTGVTLETLKVTGAMQNSYVLRFTNADSILDGLDHEIVITVKDSQGNVFEKVIIYNSEKDYTAVTIRPME